MQQLGGLQEGGEGSKKQRVRREGEGPGGGGGGVGKGSEEKRRGGEEGKEGTRKG